LTAEAWQGMGEDRPELWLFGVEPELAEPLGARYFAAPSDREVNELLNGATALVQTSRHEGFCLPLLEAMAAGAPVVCTDAHGNREFCRDGDNCLMAADDPASVAAALERLFGDAELRARRAAGGVPPERREPLLRGAALLRAARGGGGARAAGRVRHGRALDRRPARRAAAGRGVRRRARRDRQIDLRAAAAAGGQRSAA